MIPNMASDHWIVDSDHEVILPDAVCPHCSYSPTCGMAPHSHQTPHPVVSHGIPISISPHPNGGRVDLVVHLVMSNNRLELAGPSTVSATSSIVIDGTLQEESGGNPQLQRQPISSTAEFPLLQRTFRIVTSTPRLTLQVGVMPNQPPFCWEKLPPSNLRLRFFALRRKRRKEVLMILAPDFHKTPHHLGK
jgi:hypothetical protein